MAAAFFNGIAPGDWQATSAGLEPQSAISSHTIQLLADSPDEALLDLEPPRSLAAVNAPDSIVAIDCEVPGAERWDLAHQEIDEATRDELRHRVEVLAREIQRGCC